MSSEFHFCHRYTWPEYLAAVIPSESEVRKYVPERTCEFKPFRGEVERGVCSECSVFMHSQMRYCPNCGARVVYPKK